MSEGFGGGSAVGGAGASRIGVETLRFVRGGPRQEQPSSRADRPLLEPSFELAESLHHALGFLVADVRDVAVGQME